MIANISCISHVYSTQLLYNALFTHVQWGRGTVFQEDYFDLLNAAEIGMQITYAPNNAEALLKNFTTLYNNAITEVHTCIRT